MDEGLKKYSVLMVCVVLALATFIAFEQVRRNDFINLDDDVYVTDNPQVKTPITRRTLIWAFTNKRSASWHPLTWLSHMLDYQLFGLNPCWHHLTSLLFHIINTLLLFGILKKMTGAVWASAFVAAAFALHPQRVESVAWVAERKDVLSGLFWMLTIAAYIWYVQQPQIGRYLLIVCAFCLGLMAKSMLVSLPFVLLLLDYWPLDRFQWSRQNNIEDLPPSEADSPYHQKWPPWRLIIEKIPLFALATVTCVFTYIAPQKVGASKLMQILPLSWRLANALVSYVSYIAKMIYPTNLAVLYPHPGFNLPSWQPKACLVVLAVASMGVIFIARRYRYIAVGWLWYLGTLIPVIGLVQVGSQALADRFTYLPSIGIFIMAAWGISELLAKWRYRNFALSLSAGILLTAMLFATRIQVSYWQNSATLYERTLTVTKNNSIIHNNYGAYLFSQGRFDEAITQFKHTLKIDPGDLKAYNNIAKALFKQGKIDQAIENWQKALQLSPKHPEVHLNMALALAQKGEYDNAIKHLNEALRAKPNWAAVYINLGVIYYQQGRLDLAVKQFTEALHLKPDFLRARINLARILLELGKVKPAVEEYYQILELKPQAIYVLNDLAWILATTENREIYNPTNAVGLAQKACELTNYEQPKLLDTLAVAYAAVGSFGEAIETAEKALDLALSSNQQQLADEIKNHLELYRRGQAYRDSAQSQKKHNP